MKLGNSGGKNKGKKYLKITGFETITPQNQAKADALKKWFGDNYNLLVKELINKGTHDEDVLNDTFLRLYERVLFGGLEIAVYKGYFHRAFFTNYMQKLFNEQKDAEVKTSIGTDAVNGEYEPIDDSENNLSLQEQHAVLLQRVLAYIYKKYPYEEYVLYLENMQGIPKCELKETYKLSLDVITRIIEKIKKDVQTQFKYK